MNTSFQIQFGIFGCIESVPSDPSWNRLSRIKLHDLYIWKSKLTATNLGAKATMIEGILAL